MGTMSLLGLQGKREFMTLLELFCIVPFAAIALMMILPAEREW